MKSACILEGRHRLDGFLRCTGKDESAVALLQLTDRNGDVVLADTKKSAGADDGVGDRFVRSNDDVVGFSDCLALIVVDGLSQDLALGAPSHAGPPAPGPPQSRAASSRRPADPATRRLRLTAWLRRLPLWQYFAS